MLENFQMRGRREPCANAKPSSSRMVANHHENGRLNAPDLTPKASHWPTTALLSLTAWYR
jgi:hypothetical protein